MCVENSLSHPAMITFIRLLLLLSKSRRSEKSTNSCNKVCTDGDNEALEQCNEDKSRHRRHAVVFKWHLMYTLINNPDLRMERCGYMQAMRKARDLGIRIPKSDGFIVFDDDFLQEAEEQEKNAIQEKISNFRLKMRSEVRKVVKHFHKPSKVEIVNDVTDQNVIEMETV